MIDDRFGSIRVGLIISIVAGIASVATTSRLASTPPAQCQLSGPVVRIGELGEASGIAVSRRSPGRLWAHNDSGEPELVALDTRGSVTGRLRLSGLKLEDWEAVAVGACPSGSCIYVADIGDNDAHRKHITVYRVVEPAAGEASAVVKDLFHGTYPDGAHDAETLLVAPDGAMFIVTKGDAAALYRFPREVRPGATHQLELVGKPRQSRNQSESDPITDGAVSSDGTWVILRTKRTLAFHRAADLFAGNWQEAGRVDLKGIGEIQGEGAAIAPDGAVYLIGEGGGRSQPGTFARFACSFTARVSD